MIDLNHIEKYRENNRIEAKKALGGLPHSIWETYSAFANTLGGIILLGVEEYRDKTLHTVDLPDPEKLVGEFWELVNDPHKASVNILTDENVEIEEVNGDHIIVIKIPQAQRYYKPVYIDGNPVSGTYRRSGEGDYHCTEEELRAMYRDADAKTQDMLVLDQMDASVFCKESVRAYRQRMSLSRPNHEWEKLDDGEFLMKLGAAGIGEDGKVHPTAAGLLMFGYEYEILREYPRYFLDYREENDGAHRLTDRIVSSSGDWSGNVFDFYYRVYHRLQLEIKVPSETQGPDRIDDTPVLRAVREALANCLVNADYYGRRGLVIIKKRGSIQMSNPGEFRMKLSEARSGGFSDPRNSVMMKMFNMIDIGERAGNGIPSILYVWKQQGWNEPTITQTFNPNRITLSLPLEKTSDKKPAAKTEDKKSAITSAKKQLIVVYLTDHPSARAAEIAEYIGMKPPRVRDYLAELIDENIVVADGANRSRTYRLKA